MTVKDKLVEKFGTVGMVLYFVLGIFIAFSLAFACSFSELLGGLSLLFLPELFYWGLLAQSHCMWYGLLLFLLCLTARWMPTQFCTLSLLQFSP